ncbi:MAG: type II secretion system protein GspE, partial [Deltaproteobacteria bacterium]|nr:type II secretion system protein GspE [Deltaproteobacteria bacterium]
VRKICGHCKESVTPDKSTLDDLGLSANDVFYRGTGCSSCMDTGYKGRTGIFELLVMDNDIRELVKGGADSVTMKETAIRKGMATLFEDGLAKVRTGTTTLEEVMRVSQE